MVTTEGNKTDLINWSGMHVRILIYNTDLHLYNLIYLYVSQVSCKLDISGHHYL